MISSLDQMVGLFRIKQWIKNIFIFAPLIFSGQLFRGEPFIRCLITYLGFSLVTSSIYILNDFLDRQKDLIHPKKATRFLVKNDIGAMRVFVLIVIPMISGLMICSYIGPSVMSMALVYIFLNLIYNWIVKSIVVLDVVFVAFGFLIRIWSGALTIDVVPTFWLQFCVFLLALFLGFTKRRCELHVLNEQAPKHRVTLGHYSIKFLDRTIQISGLLTIVSYFLYTLSADTIAHGGNRTMFFFQAFLSSQVLSATYIL